MFSSPKITVLMPVYNCELYIKEAVDSILSQTFSDFEFLIIDDASTDKTVEIIKKYKDQRIQLIEKSKNSGYTNSLNYGLSIAKGKYIARMDGDDISLPTRFEKQVAFMEAYPDVIVCGTLYQIIDTNKVCNHPTDHEAIKVKLITGCHIAHPTVMMQREFIAQNKIQYDVEMEPAEDYDLWSRLAFMAKLANLDEVLLHYRVHQNQTSSLRNNKQLAVSKSIRLRMLQKLITSLTEEEVSIDSASVIFNNQKKHHLIKKQIQVLKKLKKENEIKRIYRKDLFEDFIRGEKKHLTRYFYNNKKEISLFHRMNIFFYEIPIFRILGIKKSLALFLK